MMSRSICAYARRWRGALVAAVLISLVLVGAACGESRPAARPASEARLSGNVTICAGDFRKCSNVAATVSVLSEHGEAFGHIVARQYAKNGRFSFLLAP